MSDACKPRIALFQPDIAGNTGTILRLAACFGLAVDLIEPAGFDASDRALKRAGMDYATRATLVRHADWDAFETTRVVQERELVLVTVRATTTHTDHDFSTPQTLLFGRESAGLPQPIHEAGHRAIGIPMRPECRSLNLAVSVGIVAAEAMRQLDWPV